MAQWVEHIYGAYPALVRREAAWLAAHPDDVEARGKLTYYRHALAVASQIAFYLRTFRLAPPAA